MRINNLCCFLEGNKYGLILDGMFNSILKERCVFLTNANGDKMYWNKSCYDADTSTNKYLITNLPSIYNTCQENYNVRFVPFYYSSYAHHEEKSDSAFIDRFFLGHKISNTVNNIEYFNKIKTILNITIYDNISMFTPAEYTLYIRNNDVTQNSENFTYIHPGDVLTDVRRGKYNILCESDLFDNITTANSLLVPINEEQYIIWNPLDNITNEYCVILKNTYNLEVEIQDGFNLICIKKTHIYKMLRLIDVIFDRFNNINVDVPVSTILEEIKEV